MDRAKLEPLQQYQAKSQPFQGKKLKKEDFLRQLNKIAQDNQGQFQKKALQLIDQLCEKKTLNKPQIPFNPKLILKEEFNLEVFDQPICELIELEENFCQNIKELMATKKLYFIRQKFRKLILNSLGLENLEFYLFHQSGKVEFHDFKENFITQVLESNEKRKKLQFILADTLATVQNIDVNQNISFAKLFQVLGSKEQAYQYVGQINKSNEQYSIVVLYTFHFGRIYQVNHKILQKAVKLSLIEIQQETQCDTLQFYSKELLDILSLIVNDTQHKVIVPNRIRSKIQNQLQGDVIDKNQKKMNIQRSLKYQQYRYELLERVRIYSKYICEDGVIFMDFNSAGQLCFLSDNRRNSDLSSLLAKLYLSKELCIQKIFSSNLNLQQHIKKVIDGVYKNKRLVEVQSGMKSRIIQNQQGDIIRIQVIIQDPIDNQSSCSSSTLGGYSSKKKVSSNSDSFSLGKKNKSTSNLIKKLQKQNPGILKDGWLNLFIKDHEIKRKDNIMSKKKTSLFARGDDTQSNPRSLKNLQFEKMQILKQLDIYSPELNLLQLQIQQLEPFTKKVFGDLKFFKKKQIKKDFFGNFLADLHQGYSLHQNPFHNFTHGVNVMHTCFLLSNLQKNSELLTPIKLFSTVLSGLCHDVGHTGRTNSFQIASKSKKALTYNDISPLQNYHASFTFQILKRPENNFLQDLSVEQQNEIRKDIISNILYTDIKEHFPLIKKFKTIQYNPQEGKLLTNQQISVLTGMITHTSDFGGSAKEFQVCQEWSRRVNIEFSAQYKMQAELGIPQTPFFKDLEIQATMAKNEMGFLKVIVFPLYEAMNNFYSGEQTIRVLTNFTENNIKKWQEVQIESIKQKDKKQQNS